MDKQQIKARFFGANIGGTVNVFGMARYINGGVTWDENGVFKFFDGYEYHQFDAKCKLVLRPLSSITDEEVSHCESIEKSMQRSKWNENAVGLAVGDYIRSRGICVPFCGYEPVAEEWAILEEKIPANH